MAAAYPNPGLSRLGGNSACGSIAFADEDAPLIENFLTLEGMILDRLRTAVPSIVRLLTVAELADLAEGALPVPAVHVIYGGYSPEFETGSGTLQQIQQTWLTAVSVRNVRHPRTGAGVRQDAGPLIMTVLQSLSGWRPSEDFTALRLASAPDPVITQGYGYFPLAWTTQLLLET
jgi:hypothetical protein